MFYILSLITAILIDMSLIHTNGNIPGISVCIWQVFFICTLLVSHKKITGDFYWKSQKSWSSIILLFLTVVLSIWFSIYTNILFTWVFLTLLVFFDILLVTLVYSSHIDFGKYPAKDISLIYFIYNTISNNLSIASLKIRDLLYKNEFIKTHISVVMRACYGLFFLLIIIVPLLASSDAIFSKILGDFFSSLFYGTNIVDFVIRLFTIMAIFWFILTTFLALGNTQYISNEIELPTIKINKIYNYIILGGINVIYCLFVLIQFRYTWFVDSSNFVNLGISYGEYIHSGFYQLIVIAIINYCIYLFFYKKTHKKGEIGIKINLYILLIATLMITYSALSRILLYIEVYHMTVLRFFVVYIVVCILVLFIFNICNLYNESKRYTGVFLTIILTSFIGIGYFNVDSFVARYNIAHSKSDYSNLDTAYIFSLSNDAINEKAELLYKRQEISSIRVSPLDSLSILLDGRNLPDMNRVSFFHYNFYQRQFLSHIAQGKN